MRERWTARSGVFCLVLCAMGGAAQAQQANVPEIRYESVRNFLKMPPDVYLGEVAGVAVNSKGHVFVFSRGNSSGPAYGAAAAQLLEFDADGKFLREIGHNLYAWSFAHSVKVDREDNIWVADKGSDMVIKFDPQGRVAMVFGRKQEASALFSGTSFFNRFIDEPAQCRPRYAPCAADTTTRQPPLRQSLSVEWHHAGTAWNPRFRPPALVASRAPRPPS